MDKELLNRRFALPGRLLFRAGPGGIVVAEMDSGQAFARVALLGAQVIHFQRNGGEPVLWLSSASRFHPGEAIRGGIPVIWPWFGAHPDDPGKPAHGFVRTALWNVRGSTVDDGAVVLRLGLNDDDATRVLWPHPFDLELTVRLGTSLRVGLLSRNPGDLAFVLTQALHSYFSVGDIARTRVTGLEGARYLDKVDAFKSKAQVGPVTIEGETDRIYVDTADECIIDDEANRRRIRIAKSGSRSTVVWNPGPAKAARLADMPDDAYRRMLCVETANAAGDQIKLLPGGEHRLEAEISVESL